MRRLFSGLLLASSLCWGQSEFTIPLQKANPELALPGVAMRNGVVYAAYRSFDLLRFSNQLQVVAYDVSTRKELQHVVISIPKVHGARASEGLFLSEDGQTLAYAELHEPGLILLLATKNLAEINRSNVLPFAPQDRKRMFVGFDRDQLCMASDFYQSDRPDSNGLRFIRLGISDLKTISDNRARGVWQADSGPIVWLPREQRTWVNLSKNLATDAWTEYTEAGQKTGQVLEHQLGISNGAVALGDGKLIAFYGNMVAKGSIVSYADHHSSDLDLKCVPHSYSSGDVADYAGALCTTSPDREPEHGGDKILSSEFLLLRADGPTIAWRHPMNFLSVADSNEPDTGIQIGAPLLYRVGSKLLIVAPTKTPVLMVYEIDAPQ